MQPIDILIPTVLALTMFGVGTSLKVEDFKRIAEHPKTIGIGIGLQMLLLPFIAFLLAFTLPIKDEWKLGLIILSLCPGGATSNFVSYLLDLRTALSISLTALNSVLIMITIPLGVEFGTSLFDSGVTDLKMSFADTILNVILVILIPATLGLLFRKRYQKLADKTKKPMQIITTLMLGLVFSIKYFADKKDGGGDIGLEDISILLPIMLSFHLVNMIGSYWIALYAKREHLAAITIGIEVGLQNTTLALLVSTVLLGNTEVAKPTLVYAIFSFFTTITFGYMAKKELLKPRILKYSQE